MQCKYGDVWLTGTPWQEDCGVVVPRGQALVQVDDIVRGSTPHIVGRGNKAVTLEVPVVLQLGGWIDALRYTHEIFWNLPDDGELFFVEQWDTEALEITYPVAALQSSEPQRVGETAVRVVHRFIVTGPPTFSATSGNPLRIFTETGESLTTES